MNKLEQYERDYAFVRSKIRTVPVVDLNRLRQLESELHVPIDQLITADDNDEKERLMDEAKKLLKGYLADREDVAHELFDWLSADESSSALQSDVLFLYGAGGTARPRQAATLYSEHNQPVIVSDADEKVRGKFRNVLEERGVKGEDILMETKGRNYLENAYYSFQVASQSLVSIRRVGIVTEALVSRRALEATRMYAPSDVSLSSFPMLIDHENEDRDTTTPDIWYKTDDGLTMLAREMMSFRLYERFGLIKEA